MVKVNTALTYHQFSLKRAATMGFATPIISLIKRPREARIKANTRGEIKVKQVWQFDVPESEFEMSPN